MILLSDHLLFLSLTRNAGPFLIKFFLYCFLSLYFWILKRLLRFCYCLIYGYRSWQVFLWLAALNISCAWSHCDSFRAHSGRKLTVGGRLELDESPGLLVVCYFYLYSVDCFLAIWLETSDILKRGFSWFHYDVLKYFIVEWWTIWSTGVRRKLEVQISWVWLSKYITHSSAVNISSWASELDLVFVFLISVYID